MQDRDFTIRKKKSRKEVEFLIGSRGMSENRTLIASNSKKEDRDIISPFIIDNGFEISEMSPQLRE
jgi:IS30 family transposase